jgi:hypothetical protein
MQCYLRSIYYYKDGFYVQKQWNRCMSKLVLRSFNSELCAIWNEKHKESVEAIPLDHKTKSFPVILEHDVALHDL